MGDEARKLQRIIESLADVPILPERHMREAVNQAGGLLMDVHREIIAGKPVGSYAELVGEQSSGDAHPTRHRLGWGIVRNAGRVSVERKPRWAHVADATGLGSTSAQALCREHGCDPDEEVGGEAEGAESDALDALVYERTKGHFGGDPDWRTTLKGLELSVRRVGDVEIITRPVPAYREAPVPDPRPDTIIAPDDLCGRYGRCRECGTTVYSYTCNAPLIAVRPEGETWDWWAACGNRDCPRHYGEGYFQDPLEWVSSDA